MASANSWISSRLKSEMSSTIILVRPIKALNGFLKSCAIIEKNLSFSEITFKSCVFFEAISS